MRRRLSSLRLAAVLAGGFVLLRVLYRVVFGGAGGSGILIVELPRIRLEGPFSHIALFGDVTTGGIWLAAVSALPFAGLILAFGVLSVVVDLRALLARGAVRGPMRTVSRALVVAWATFPALVESVRRVRIARELRGERSAASLLVPVLEQTIEQAIALGASMEVRGFASTRPVDPVCERPAVIRDAALGFAHRWTLEAVDLDFAPGTLTLITGATGSGKSTLLDALSGLFQRVSGGDQRGDIEVGGADRVDTPPRETAGFVGVVSQSPRLGFVATTVAEELGFAVAMRGAAAEIVHARAAEVAARLGIGHLLDRETTALSAGEACLVAIGAAVVTRPVLLLVDEPLADLDDAARRRVVTSLDQLAHEAGVCVVVAEHAVREWGATVDVRLDLRDGTVYEGEPSVAVGAIAPRSGPRNAPVVARVDHLSVEHGDIPAVDDVSLTLCAGELVALRGPNGAGKSSLLHGMARPAASGTVVVGDRDIHQLGRRTRRHAIALVPEAFDDLLFSITVAQECRRADRFARTRGTAERFAGFLGNASAGDATILLDRHPRDLSAGQRLCLVLAIQLAAHPGVLLVDEPTRGLDAAARDLVGTALVSATASGAAVVVATHDADFAQRFATRTLTMESGRLRDGARVPS
ncbi:MAG: ATP-binding cassette domain-containing protein [Pseudolysinimonas sp.]